MRKETQPQKNPQQENVCQPAEQMQVGQPAGPYDDIINLPHHQSTRHAHMDNAERAAQFSPFQALTGYGDAIDETLREEEKRIARQDRPEAFDRKIEAQEMCLEPEVDD